MATKCEKTKLLTVTNNVVKLVPAAIEQKTKSITLMQEMTGILISSILYYRKLVPNEDFETRRLDQDNVNILKCNSNNPIALKVVELTHSIYEAIKLEYLREVMIVIESENEVVETHNLSFQYSGDTFSMQIDFARRENKKISEKKLGCELVTKQIKSILKSLITVLCIDVPNLQKPSLHFRLRFYENVTPPDYQPPCFEPENPETKTISLQTQSMNSGTISTPFHTFKVKSKFLQTITDKILTFNVEENTSEITGEKKLEGANDKKGSDNLDLVVPPSETAKSLTTPKEMNSNDSNTVLYNTQEKDTISLDASCTPENKRKHSYKDTKTKNMNTSEKLFLRCPCGISQLILPHYLLCDLCNFAQHAACFKIPNEAQAPAMHICDVCATDEFVSTVPEMSSMKKEEKRMDCLLRLSILIFGSDSDGQTPETLATLLHIDYKSAHAIIEELKNMSIIQKKNSK